MNDGDILVIGGEDIRELLDGQEAAVLAAVRDAYLAHARGLSALPHSSFLRFPGRDADRIIALPAFLGDGFEVAGLKWIASFPGNLDLGLARASAVLILNSCATGRPEAILEGSLISAARTAASAATAAAALLGGRPPERVGLIGAGLINLEVARFLRAALPGTARFLLYDLDPARAARAAAALRQAAAGGTAAVEAEVATDAGEVLSGCPLISFATTATRPHVADLSGCRRGAVILHVSLRDLTPQALLACDNIVDDPDHVCRAETSAHLAEQLTGSRAFIRCTLADVLQGHAAPRRDDESIAVFSPFGLGILDLAVGKLVRDRALAGGRSTLIRAFQPAAGS
jgi:2,3-diaminopropionate biosynthesis protein SbnB